MAGGGGGGGDRGEVTERRGEGRSFCEASVFNRERIRHGQNLFICPPQKSISTTLTALLDFLVFFSSPLETQSGHIFT